MFLGTSTGADVTLNCRHFFSTFFLQACLQYEPVQLTSPLIIKHFEKYFYFLYPCLYFRKRNEKKSQKMQSFYDYHKNMNMRKKWGALPYYPPNSALRRWVKGFEKRNPGLHRSDNNYDLHFLLITSTFASSLFKTHFFSPFRLFLKWVSGVVVDKIHDIYLNKFFAPKCSIV